MAPYLGLLALIYTLYYFEEKSPPCYPSAYHVSSLKFLLREKYSSFKVNAKCALLFSVSKPDAENPVVKRTKIPRPEKEEISRNYQRNSTAPKIEGKLYRYNGCFLEFRESVTMYGDKPWPLPCLDLSSTLSN